jgi:uncharacterized RDD family membrane protein YckC
MSANPYQPPSAVVADQSIEYAGFWVRVGATLIDSFLLILLIYPLLVAFYGMEYFDAEKTGLIAGPADLVISWIAPALAVIAFWKFKQATPGKMMLSMRIVDASTGNPPSAGQCLGRYLAYFVSIIPLALGVVWVAFDKRKQGWHDKLAGTVVIRK